MKLSVFALFLCVASALAQYVSQEAAPAAASENTIVSFVQKLISSGPAVALLSTIGFNVSAADEKLWDERIQLITDTSYQDLVVNESLTPKEEKERAWVLVITGQAVRQDDISKMADSIFDAAYEETLKANDLPHVRWGRIDYQNVTRLTTKWAIWRVPYIVIITDRGQTLRFYRYNQVRLTVENLREFLKTKDYLQTPSWSTAYSPGGEYEYILDHFANILDNIYKVLVIVPRWILLIVSGTFASILLGLLHKSGNNTSSSKSAKSKSAITRTTNAITPSDEKQILEPVVKHESSSNKTASTTTTSTTSTKAKPAPKSPAKSPKAKAKAPSPSKSPATLTPAATDSELEFSKPKRASTRNKKPKKT